MLWCENFCGGQLEYFGGTNLWGYSDKEVIDKIRFAGKCKRSLIAQRGENNGDEYKRGQPKGAVVGDIF